MHRHPVNPPLMAPVTPPHPTMPFMAIRTILGTPTFPHKARQNLVPRSSLPKCSPKPPSDPPNPCNRQCLNENGRRPERLRLSRRNQPLVGHHILSKILIDIQGSFPLSLAQITARSYQFSISCRSFLPPNGTRAVRSLSKGETIPQNAFWAVAIAKTDDNCILH